MAIINILFKSFRKSVHIICTCRLYNYSTHTYREWIFLAMRFSHCLRQSEPGGVRPYVFGVLSQDDGIGVVTVGVVYFSSTP